MVSHSDKKVTCIEANNTIVSLLSIIRCRSIFKMGGLACCNVHRWTFRTCVQIDLRKHYFRTLTMLQNQGWFAAKKGIECLHIKFTLAEDVFESRITQKQGENAEYMFESRTTQMQERENDEDITNMDTPTVVLYMDQRMCA
jgi:hypothetical protein